MCNKVFKRAKERGSLPKRSSKDPQEQKDYHWICKRRKAKSGKSKHVWHTEFNYIAKQYGFPDAFNTKDREQELCNKCHDIFKRAQERGSLPKRSSKDPQERKDVEWIYKKREAKLGKSHHCWYPEFEQIAKQYGFPDAFN